MAGLVKEFKEFISRGNVVQLAVAVVIGTAFTALVMAVVEGLITPLVGMVGGTDFEEMVFTVNDSGFRYGLVINAVIFFLVVAAVVFFGVVKPLNMLEKRRRRGEEPVDEAQLSDEAALLTEIRDLLAVQGPTGAGLTNPTPPPGGAPPAGGA